MTATVRPSRGIGRSSRRLACVALLAALPLTACAAGYQAETSRERTTLTSVAGAVGDLTLRNVFLIGDAPSGGSIPLYMAVFNGGTTPDKLVSISAQGASGGYVPTDATVPASGSLYYNDGDGVVPQLTGLTTKVLVGQSLNVKIVFQNAGELDITVPVITSEKDANGNPLPTPSAVPSSSAATPTPAASGSAPESASPSPEASPSGSASASPSASPSPAATP